MSEDNATDPHDPQGLMHEAFRIEDLALSDCRGLFFSWVLGLGEDADVAASIHAILERSALPAHPMTQVLNEGLERYHGRSGRRGGWRGRRRKEGAGTEDAEAESESSS